MAIATTKMGAPRAPRLVRATPRGADALVDVVVALGVPERRTSEVVRALRSAPPLPKHLRHVKRARRSMTVDGATDVVLKVRDDAWDDAVSDARACAVLRREVLERCGEATGRLAYAAVPGAAPSDPESWARACEVWPVTLVTTTEREAEDVSEAEEGYFWRWIRVACAGAGRRTDGGRGNCAVVVDPVRDCEVARGVDESATHPLRHAAICAVDLAARLDVEKYPEKEHVEALVESRRAEKLARELEDAEMDDNKKRKRESQVSGALVTEVMGRPYLCTGYDVFLAREPCIMCAMALVHSRLKRVIFAVPDDVNGALNGPPGVRRLHGVKSLNHHYLVYSFDMNEDELRSISDE